MLEIVAIKYKLVNLAIISGYLLLRWTKGVLVIFDKADGNINVQKLLAILLL